MYDYEYEYSLPFDLSCSCTTCSDCEVLVRVHTIQQYSCPYLLVLVQRAPHPISCLYCPLPLFPYSCCTVLVRVRVRATRTKDHAPSVTCRMSHEADRGSRWGGTGWAWACSACGIYRRAWVRRRKIVAKDGLDDPGTHLPTLINPSPPLSVLGWAASRLVTSAVSEEVENSTSTS